MKNVISVNPGCNLLVSDLSVERDKLNACHEKGQEETLGMLFRPTSAPYSLFNSTMLCKGKNKLIQCWNIRFFGSRPVGRLTSVFENFQSSVWNFNRPKIYFFNLAYFCYKINIRTCHYLYTYRIYRYSPALYQSSLFIRNSLCTCILILI